MELESGEAYLGGPVFEDGTPQVDEATILELDDLTTHGVIVGMTGSGKTGLGIDLLEEATLSGVPTLILDPKGDMGNLLLTFPKLAPEAFRPWIDEGEAARNGVSPEELAATTATTWKDGLASWDIESDRLQKIVDASEMTIYTPGSTSGVPLNILGSLKAPDLSWDTDREAILDEIEGFVSSLLVLAGIDANPVSDPEPILLATLIEKAWQDGKDLDLATLVGQIPRPPIRKLGVFELDSFFPEKDRMELAKTLNGLLASPSFGVWLEGEPLDIEAMLTGGDKTKSAILYLAHLSDTERQFLVTLVLSKMVTWIRQQSGTSQLRALIYMDEVFGFAPPTAQPPSKKPILTILKQARAHGVGMVLSTQNPVDLDYKAMSNAGTWMIGRLQTERDKMRILEGLEAASGAVSSKDLDPLITGLEKRQFLLHSTRADQPTTFTTRWAMAYLAGPFTRDEVAALTKEDAAAPAPDTEPAKPEPQPAAASESASAEPATLTEDDTAVASAPTQTATQSTPESDDTVPVAPTVASDIETVYLQPDAPWASQIGSIAEGSRYRAGVVATVSLRFDERTADLDHTEDYEAVLVSPGDPITPETVVSVDHDDRDFGGPPDGKGAWELVDAKIENKGWWSSLSSDLRDFLGRSHQLKLWLNKALDTVSRPGETKEEFQARCAEVAEAKADEELAELREEYAEDAERLKDKIADTDRRIAELETDVDSRKKTELLSGAVDLVGSLVFGRSKSSALRRAARSRSTTRRTEARRRSEVDERDELEQDLVELEDTLEEKILEITDRWEDMVTEIEELSVGLERDDIDVIQLRLLWYPV